MPTMSPLPKDDRVFLRGWSMTAAEWADRVKGQRAVFTGSKMQSARAATKRKSRKQPVNGSFVRRRSPRLLEQTRRREQQARDRAARTLMDSKNRLMRHLPTVPVIKAAAKLWVLNGTGAPRPWLWSDPPFVEAVRLSEPWNAPRARCGEV